MKFRLCILLQERRAVLLPVNVEADASALVRALDTNAPILSSESRQISREI